MNSKAISRLSADIILAYYDNNVDPFLDNVDEDVLWYGPAEGQFIRGRQAMIDAWAAEGQPLSFSVRNIGTTSVSRGTSLTVVVVTYCVITHYPSGNDIPIDQRITFTWCERYSRDERGKRISTPRILVCDITNPHPKSEEDQIYPVHFEQVYSNFTAAPALGERLRFRGMGNNEYFILASMVVWGESCGNGQRSILHLLDGKTVEVTVSIREITAEHPDLFLRCHRSYLVNPLHVTCVDRFSVTMRDGAKLPVPEKSYTAFKRALAAAVQEKK